MDYIATPKETARLFHCAPDQTPINEKSLRRLCIAGELIAQRVGNRWYINVTKSFPNLQIAGEAENLAS